MAKGVDIEIARLDEDQVRAKIAIFFGVASFFVEHAKRAIATIIDSYRSTPEA